MLCQQLWASSLQDMFTFHMIKRFFITEYSTTSALKRFCMRELGKISFSRILRGYVSQLKDSYMGCIQDATLL